MSGARFMARRAWVAPMPIDLRKGLDSLWGVARQLHLCPLDGDVVIFLNRRRNRCKVLLCVMGRVWLCQTIVEPTLRADLRGGGQIVLPVQTELLTIEILEGGGV